VGWAGTDHVIGVEVEVLEPFIEQLFLHGLQPGLGNGFGHDEPIVVFNELPVCAEHDVLDVFNPGGLASELEMLSVGPLELVLPEWTGCSAQLLVEELPQIQLLHVHL